MQDFWPLGYPVQMFCQNLPFYFITFPITYLSAFTWVGWITIYTFPLFFKSIHEVWNRTVFSFDHVLFLLTHTYGFCIRSAPGARAGDLQQTAEVLFVINPTGFCCCVCQLTPWQVTEWLTELLGLPRGCRELKWMPTCLLWVFFLFPGILPASDPQTVCSTSSAPVLSSFLFVALPLFAREHSNF